MVGQSPQIAREARGVLGRPSDGQLGEDVVLIGVSGGRRVDDVTFDGVVRYLGEHPQVEFGSGRVMGWDRDIGDADDRRAVHVRDPDGHS